MRDTSAKAHYQVCSATASRLMLFSTSGWLMLSTAGTSLLGLLFWVLCTRMYSAGTVGEASADISAAMLAASAAGAGLAPAGAQRFLECCESGRRVHAALADIGLALVVGTLAGPVVLLTRLFVPQVAEHETSCAAAMVIAAAGVPMLTAGLVLDGLCVADGRAAVAAMRNLCTSAAKVALLFVALWAAHTCAAAALLPWCCATAIGLVAGVVAFLLPLRPLLPLLPNVLWVELGSLRRLLGPYQLIGLGCSLWMYALPVVVAARLGTRQNAYSSAAWMASGPLFKISGSVATAVFVQGYRSPAELGAILARAGRFTAVLLLPCCGAFVLAGPRLLVLFGAGYACHAAALVQLLAAASLPDAVTNLATAAMRVRGSLRSAAALNIAMPSLSLVLSWIWLPTYGISASAWAWGIGQLAGACTAGCWFCWAFAAPHRRPAARGAS